MADWGKGYSVEESLRSLEKDIKDLTKEMADKAKKNVELLAGTAHAMIVAKANTKLKSTRSIYIENLDLKKLSASGDNVIHAVVLYKGAGWIENGQAAHNMIDYLVNGKSGKVSKKGHKYAIIPFEHSKSADQRSAKQDVITKYVNKELKSRGLDKVITRDGKPVLGRAATVDLIARGSPQSEKSFRPLLSGLTIYQSLRKNKHGEVIKNKSGEPRVRRDIMTFRVVSETQRGKGLWDNPGRAPANFFEQVARELDPIWEMMCKELVK